MAGPAAGHRCLVVIHGLGQEPRGQTLIDIGDPLIEFLAHGEPDLVVLRSDISPAAVSMATAQCQLRAGTLNIREAWWAGRFVAPAFAPILMWTVAVWSTQARSVVFGLWHSLWRDQVGTTADLQRAGRSRCTD